MEKVSHSLEDTHAIGAKLARQLKSGDVVALVGDIGAGKTTFVRGVAEGLGIPPDHVASPSFVLIREYSGGRLTVHHADLFRLEGMAQAASVGLEEFYDAGGVVLIEWAQKIPDILPEQYLELKFETLSPQGRRFTAVPHGKRYEGRPWLA